VLWGCRCEKFISSSFRVRSTVSQKNARTSGHELLVELCASDSVYWPLFTGADFLGAMGVVAPIQNWLSGCGGAPKKEPAEQLSFANFLLRFLITENNCTIIRRHMKLHFTLDLLRFSHYKVI